MALGLAGILGILNHGKDGNRQKLKPGFRDELLELARDFNF